MKIFITDNEGNLIPVDGKSVVIELNSGGTIEIAEEYSRDDVPEDIICGEDENLPLHSHSRKLKLEQKALVFTPLQPMPCTYSRTNFHQKNDCIQQAKRFSQTKVRPLLS